MPSFICRSALEKKVFDFFFFCNLEQWQPYWSCDLDHLNKHSFSSKNADYEILILIGQAVSEEKMFKLH